VPHCPLVQAVCSSSICRAALRRVRPILQLRIALTRRATQYPPAHRQTTSGAPPIPLSQTHCISQPNPMLTQIGISQTADERSVRYISWDPPIHPPGDTPREAICHTCFKVTPLRLYITGASPRSEARPKRSIGRWGRAHRGCVGTITVCWEGAEHMALARQMTLAGTIYRRMPEGNFTVRGR
jgi:hypothetical protein